MGLWQILVGASVIIGILAGISKILGWDVRDLAKWWRNGPVRVLRAAFQSRIRDLSLRRSYSLEALEEDIELDIRSGVPLDFSLSSYVPRASVWLRITNKSPHVDLEVDVLTVEIWARQPLVNCLSVERTSIPRGSTEHAFCKTFLNSIQVDRLREIKQEQEDKGKEVPFTLYITVQFDTKLGKIKKEARKERVPARISS